MPEEPIHNVFILGCGRSGTSIFGELFEHLSPFVYHSEPPFAEVLRLDAEQPFAVKVPTESDGYPPTAGLSFPLETLLEKTPDPKRIYWIVRHPLDAICSLRPGIANNWGHHPQPPDRSDWIDRPLIERCAHHWNYINQKGYEAVRDWAKVKRFEDMILDPARFAHSICEDVGLDPSRYHDALVAWSDRVQNTDNKKFIEAQTSRNYSRPDHRTRIDRWKENLSAAEVDSVVPIIERTARGFGYLETGANR